MTAVALLLACGACAATPAAPVVAETASSALPPPRRPDGVVLEPPPAIPPTVTVADARGVVALRASLSSDAIRDCVAALLDAWQRASLDALSALLAEGAGPIEARARGPGALVEAWRQRLRSHEYKRLEGLDSGAPRPRRALRVRRAGRAGLARAPGRHAPRRDFVRVPLEVTQVAGDKLFEPTIVLLMHAEGGRARITAYGEVP